jgi:VanZ like protein
MSKINIKTIFNNKFTYWLPSIIYMVLIFVLSSFPVPDPVHKAPIYFHIKTIHVLEYGVLSLLYTFALTKYKLTARQIFWYSIGLAFFYGLTDEFHQLFVTNRTGQTIDLAGNFLGAYIFQLLNLKFNLLEKLSSISLFRSGILFKRRKK